MQRYRQLAGSLAITNGCLTYGSRVIVPAKLRHQVLDQLHQGHLGMQRMKQLARTAVYWPNIDDDIDALYFGPCWDKEARWVPAVVTK